MRFEKIFINRSDVEELNEALGNMFIGAVQKFGFHGKILPCLVLYQTLKVTRDVRKKTLVAGKDRLLESNFKVREHLFGVDLQVWIVLEVALDLLTAKRFR